VNLGLLVADAQGVALFADAATRLWPSDAEAWLNAAWVRRSSDEDAFESALQKALAVDPRCVAALFALGNRAFDQGDFATAEPLLRRTLEIDPQESRARIDLTRLAVRRRDVAALRAELASWEAAAGDSALMWSSLAESRMFLQLPTSLRNDDATERAAVRGA